MEISPENLSKLEKIQEIVQDGELGIANHIIDVEKSLRDEIEDVKNSVPDLDKILESIKGKDGYTPIKGVDFHDGEDGEDCEPEEVARILKKDKEFLKTTKGEKGDKGDIGEITITDGEISRTFSGKTIIKGYKGKDGANGNDGKDGSPDTADQIAEKLNSKEEIVEMKTIKGLKKELREIRETRAVPIAGQSTNNNTGGVIAVVAGPNITVDNTDPTRPVVSASVSGGGVTDGNKGDLTVSGTGSIWTINPNVVVNADLAQMATKTYKGRTSTLTGNAEDVPVATLKADLALTKSDVGLANVDNTSDANKPVSTAQQNAINALKGDQMSATFFGGGDVLNVGLISTFRPNYGGTFTGWAIDLADINGTALSGSIQIEVKKNGSVITASAKPTVTTATSATSTTLTGWTTTFVAGDLFEFSILSVTTAQKATLALNVTK